MLTRSKPQNKTSILLKRLKQSKRSRQSPSKQGNPRCPHLLLVPFYHHILRNLSKPLRNHTVQILTARKVWKMAVTEPQSSLFRRYLQALNQNRTQIVLNPRNCQAAALRFKDLTTEGKILGRVYLKQIQCMVKVLGNQVLGGSQPW